LVTSLKDLMSLWSCTLPESFASFSAGFDPLGVGVVG
jgi:hypothetical protein